MLVQIKLVVMCINEMRVMCLELEGYTGQHITSQQQLSDPNTVTPQESSGWQSNQSNHLLPMTGYVAIFAGCASNARAYFRGENIWPTCRVGEHGQL